jgi:predicted TIM-barrel fold metal-dependent hydrolase
MNVVDSHMHFWDSVANPYPWLTDPAPGSEVAELVDRYGVYLADEYRQDCGKRTVTATVHVQADWDARNPVAETAWLQTQHDADGIPSAIVGAAELESPCIGATLEAHLQYPLVRGIRQSLAWDPDPARSAVLRPDLMADRAWLRGFGLLAPLGLSFDLTAYPAQLTAAAAVAADHPTTSIILDHLGLPDVVAPDREAWSDGISRLAACENVSVKLSGLAQPGRSIREMLEYVEEALLAFGTHRAMYGSNLPVEHLGGSSELLVAAIELALRGYSPDACHAVWQGTATRIYRLAG